MKIYEIVSMILVSLIYCRNNQIKVMIFLVMSMYKNAHPNLSHLFSDIHFIYVHNTIVIIVIIVTISC